MKYRTHAHIGTFRQLEILLAVHEHGSITAAADVLHLTQPTVSMQLKKLSESIGMPLFDQVGRKLLFTEAGEAVVHGGREILDCLSNLNMRLAALQGLRAGKLKLGVVSTAKYFIPHLLGEFCKLYPNIDVEMNVANRQQIIERLLKGSDDFNVFSHPPENDEVELHEFMPNPLVAIAPLTHPLAKQGRISLKQFAQYPFLMREQGSGTRHAIEEHMKRFGITLDVRMTIESNEAIKHAVMSGLGVSILSSHTLAYGGHAGLKELQVAHLPIEPHWHLTRLKSKRMSLIASTFLDYVNSEGRNTLLATLAADLPHMKRLFSKSRGK